MVTRILVAGVVVLTLGGNASAQAPVQVHLDLASTTTLSQTVDPGTYAVTLGNTLPQARYAIVVLREQMPIATIPLDGVGPLGALQKLVTERTPSPCEQLAEVGKTLVDATAESQVPARRAAVVALLEQGLCAETGTTSAARTAVDGTQRTLTPMQIREGERLIVTVTRTPAQGVALTWTLTLSTEPRGEWITSYGVSFAQDRDERFNSVAIGNNQFQIKKESDEWGLKPVPSVFFSWLSSKQRDGNWAFSPTAGFGLDSSSLTMMGGLSAIYNTNLSFIVGGAFTGQRLLHGKYEPDQVVTENLSEDQLHRTRYRPAAFVSLALRFNRNPFKKDAPAAPAAPGAAPGAGATSAPGTPAAPGIPPGTPAAGGAPAGGTDRVTEAARDSDIKLKFDAKGVLREPGALQALLERVKNATDVFIVSHGWWNNENSADCFYQRMVGGISRATPSYLTTERYRPVFVTVYWPSALFPIEPSDCTRDSRTEANVAPAENFTPDGIRSWAVNAYPDAASRPEFDAEARRVAMLFEQERTASLSNAESDELAAILIRWRDASGPAAASVSEAGETISFAGSPQQVAQRWRDRPNPTHGAELSLPAFSAKKWLNFGNAFTFWTMKERAGVVGSRGLYDVLKALQPHRSRLKIHLIGHSFGGKLLSAALTGTGGPANRADSLVILQGAFSHFAFATREEIVRTGVTVDRNGLYRDVLGSSLVTGPIVVTHSTADTPNRLLYPAGVALVNDVTEAARAPRYGSLGANGILAATTASFNLATQTMATVEAQAPRAISVDASTVILGHSDLIKTQVFTLIWDAVERVR